MIFSVDAATAIEAVSLLFNLAPQKTSGDSACVVRLQVSDDELTISFSDVGISARGTFPASVKESGEAKVVFSDLFSVLRGYSPLSSDGSKGVETIEFSSKGQTSISVFATTYYDDKKVKQKRILPLCNLFFVEADLDIDFSGLSGIPFSSFYSGLSRVITSSTSVNSNIFSGVLIKIRDGNLVICGTSGVVLTEYQDVVDFDCEIEVVLPSAVVSKIFKFLHVFSKNKEESLIFIHSDGKKFILSYMGIDIKCSTLGTGFPDYSHVVSGFEKSFILDSSVLVDNLKSMSFGYNKNENFRTTLDFSPESLSIKTTGCENSDVPVVDVGSSLSIDFNASVLESSIRNLRSDLFHFMFKDKHSPVLIKSDKDFPSIKTIVAPLK